MLQKFNIVPAIFFAALSLITTSSYAQQDQSLSSALPIFKDVPGLESLPATNVKRSGNITTVQVNLRGTPTTAMAFQVNGVMLGAVVPSKFKLTDIIPIPNGTPIDGVSFSHTAFIYLPQGKKQLAAPISNYPQMLRNALPHLNGNITLNEGYNLLSLANFQSSNSIRQVLSTIGQNQFNLPVTGLFSLDLFKADPQKASAQIKDALLKSLKLDLPLPKLTIPGMPNTIVVDNARLAIVGRDVNGKPQIFAGVTGGLDVKVTNTPHRFSFGLLAGSPGKPFAPKITAESKDPVKLPFFQELDLTDMQLVAERKGNAWNTVINATAKLKGKSVAVSVHHDPAIGDTALIKTKMTLADVLPSGTSVPGLTDVEFDTIEVAKGLVQATGKIKDMDVVIAGFKHNGKTLVAVATPKPIHISSLIPGIGKTPLDDVAFAGMSYLWVPKGGAITGMKASDLPPSIAAVAGQSGTAIVAKEGVNVVGRMEIAQNGELGKLLTMAGLYKNSIPLAGSLSPAVFQKSNTTQIKNQILDNLDLNIPLPKINIPGISDVASVQHTALTIKGMNENGQRSIDVAIGGELDIDVTGSKLVLDYRADVHKQQGQPDSLALSAKQPKDQIAILKLIETFKVSELDFELTKKKNGKYDALLLGTTMFRGKSVRVGFRQNPKPNLYVSAKDLLLKDVMGTSSGVAEIDNIKFSGLGVATDHLSMGVQMNGKTFYAALVKVTGQAKPFMTLRSATAKLTVADMIPGAEKTPLKDADLENLAFLYNPTTKTGPISSFPALVRSYMPGNVAVKPGLNIFGDLILHPTGEVAKLLKMAGISQAKIPLNGGFSPKIFSKDTGSQAIKNAIIDSLDLNIPLPKITVPGISDVASVQHTALIIKGQNDNGVRSIDVAVGGELDFDVAGSKLQLDYEAAVHKQQGQPDSLALSAKQPKDQTVTINLIEPFKVSALDFSLTKQGGKYQARMLGQSTFRTKPVEVAYSNSPKPKLYVAAKDLTLKDVIGTPTNVPEIDNIKFSGFAVEPGQFTMGIEVRGQKFYGLVEKIPGQQKPFFILRGAEPQLSITALIPGTETTPLKDTDFEQVVLFYNPTNKAGLLDTFPAAIRPYFHGNVAVKPGLNIYGELVIHPTGEMASLLKDVGVTTLKLPLNGGFSPKALAQNVNASQLENAVLDSLDLQMNIPIPHIAAMEQFLTFKNGHLGIKGKLPDNKRGVAFQVSGDAELKVANEDIAFYVEVDAARSQGGQETDFEVKGHTDKPWVHPMGIEFLTLEGLGLDIRKQKTGSTNTYDVSLSAKSDIGSQKLDVLVDVHEEGNKLTDVYFELDGPLNMSEMPGLNQVPHADKFALKKLIISEHGIEADTMLGGRETDLFAFHGSGWNVALTQKDFAITEFLPQLKKTPLNEIKFPYLALMLSEKGLNKQFSQLSKVGQDALKDIFTSPSDTVRIDKGLAIIAGFHPKNAGALEGGINGIGVHDGMVVIGEIDGIFGGSPLVKLEGKLSHTGAAGHMPNGTTYRTGEEIAFFINVLESGQDFDFELGIEVGVYANIKGDNLLFDSRVKMEVMEEGFGIDVEGQMKGTWHEPFGIPKFSLTDVTIEMGTQEDGAIKLGFGGATVIADQHFKMAADGKFTEALGFPQAIAFIGSADTIPLLFIEDVALQLLGKKFDFSLPPAVLPEFKDVKFAFVTPGAEDPDLKINGEGFAMKGSLEWLGHEFAGVNVSVSPTTGIYAEERINDINLGPLKMTDNHFLMKAGGLKNIVPTISLNADIGITYLDISDKFDVTFDKKGASFETSTNFGKDFSMHNLFRLSGVDLTLTKPSFTNADFYMEGDMKLDIGKFIEEPSKVALDAVFNEVEAGFKKAEEDIKAARAKVNGITNQINAERAKVRKERAAAEHVLQSAEDRVNSLNNEIDRDWDHYHGCSGWFSWACEARWGIEIGFIKIARDVADAALELAKTSVDHFPLDFDPRIAPMIVARDVANAVLTAALDAFEGADFFDKVLKEVSDKVVELVGKSVNIHKAEFEGDLKGLIDGTQPLAVTLDAEVFGAQIEQIIPFNPRDIAYDVKQMSFLGLRALEHIVDEALNDIPSSIKHKILSNISSQRGIQQEAAKKELAKYGKAFAGYAAEEAALQKVIATRDKASMQEKYAAAHNPLDLGFSETFANDFIEVGHTALCLDNVGGLVKQDRCKDDASTRWSTKPIDGAPNVPAKAGYVYITDSKTGDCIVPEGKWGDVKKQFTNPGLPAGKAFSYTVNTFQGDGKITVAACANKREYYWKILKHGEGWMQMANRATSQCLHFKEGSSLPGQANAEWASCIGSANQIYRVADKTTPEYYASNITLKNDSQSACFSDPGADGKITMVECTKGAKYNYVIDIRGFIKFINAKTGQCIQPETYKDGAHLIEKTCTQLDFQWWSPVTVPGGWRIQNAQTNTCTRAPGLGQIAVTETCKDWAQSVIAPVIDPYSGITYTNDNVGYLNAVIPQTSANGGICAVHVASAGQTQITGTVTSDRKCYFNYNGTDQTQPAGGKNPTVTVLDGTTWQAHKMGEKIPEYAIPGGFIDSGANSKATYICRAMANRGTKFGWVAEQNPGNNLCNYQTMHGSEDARGYHRPAQEFEVLVRRADKAYLLHLGDLKPGGSKAGKDPTIKALASQKGLYEGERSAVAAPQDNQKNGTPMNSWQPDSTGGPQISSVGDIVTMKGRVRGGNRGGAIWKIPRNVAPTKTLLFPVVTSVGQKIVEVRSDGTIVPNEGYFGRPNIWVDLSSISFGLSASKLSIEGGWNTKYPYPGPEFTKVAKRVTVNGVVAGRNDNSSDTRRKIITNLPDGSRPPKQMQFNVPIQKVDESVTMGSVTVYPDGRIELDGGSWMPRNTVLISLSGISFEAAANSFDLADEYGPLLNSWKPDTQRDGGYRFTISGDVVTLDGGVADGRGGNIDKIWQLPPNARPSELQVFNVANSDGDAMRLEIHPDGLIKANIFGSNIYWINFSGVTYNRKGGNSLNLNPGWAPKTGFAKPTMTKQGNTVILGGVANPVKRTESGSQNSFGFGQNQNQSSSPSPVILHLPEGARPQKEMKFTVSVKVDGQYGNFGNVRVFPDGRVQPENTFSFISMSLSGITFSTE